jgi:hypothetical protein
MLWKLTPCRRSHRRTMEAVAVLTLSPVDTSRSETQSDDRTRPGGFHYVELAL